MILIANSSQQATDMCQKVTDSLYAKGLRWRPKSLEMLLGGSIKNDNGSITLSTPDDILRFTQVHERTILGVRLDGTGRTCCSLDFR